MPPMKVFVIPCGDMKLPYVDVGGEQVSSLAFVCIHPPGQDEKDAVLFNTNLSPLLCFSSPLSCVCVCVCAR